MNYFGVFIKDGNFYYGLEVAQLDFKRHTQVYIYIQCPLDFKIHLL